MPFHVNPVDYYICSNGPVVEGPLSKHGVGLNYNRQHDTGLMLLDRYWSCPSSTPYDKSTLLARKHLSFVDSGGLDLIS